MSSSLIRAAALIVCTAVSAAAAARAQRTHDIRPEDYFTLETITGCATAPDGRHIAFTSLGWAGADQPRRSDLWVVDTRTQQCMQLTADAADDRDPQWSADSRELFFLSDRAHGDATTAPGAMQVFRAGLHADAEPIPITQIDGGVAAFELSADGRTLYYLRVVDEGCADLIRFRRQYPDLAIHCDSAARSEIWTLDLDTRRERLLLERDAAILEFDVSGDESRIAIVTAVETGTQRDRIPMRIHVHDVTTDETTALALNTGHDDSGPRFRRISNPRFSPTGHALAWTMHRPGFPTRMLVAEWIDGDVQVRRIERPRNVAVSGGLLWLPGSDELCFLGELHSRRRVIGIADVRDGSQGRARALTAGHVVVHDFSFPRDGSVVDYVMSDTERLREIYRKTPDAPRADARRLTTMNAHTDTWKLPQVDRVQWWAPDGAEIEGILELPHDYDEDDADELLPLIVLLHGHENGANMYHWRFGIHGRTLLPARGYAVLCPNYRGSAGYGDAFMTEVIHGEPDLDVQDVLAGIDAMIDAHIVDPKRIAVIGWGRGAAMVDHLVANSPRFSAAISSAGVIDAAVSDPDFVSRARLNASHSSASPQALKDVVTPLLVHIGDGDARGHARDSRRFHRRLKAEPGVPAALVAYPATANGRQTREHREAMIRINLAWLERHALGEDAEVSAAEK